MSLPPRREWEALRRLYERATAKEAVGDFEGTAEALGLLGTCATTMARQTATHAESGLRREIRERAERRAAEARRERSKSIAPGRLICGHQGPHGDRCVFNPGHMGSWHRSPAGDAWTEDGSMLFPCGDKAGVADKAYYDNLAAMRGGGK